MFQARTASFRAFLHNYKCFWFGFFFLPWPYFGGVFKIVIIQKEHLGNIKGQGVSSGTASFKQTRAKYR